MKDKKVALVHDFLVTQGGAERVLKVLSQMYPDAPIYTLLYDKEKMRGMFEGKDIRSSYLQKYPKFLKKHYQWLVPFYPVIPETLDLREYDLVISSSGAWMKGIVTKLSTTHIAYIHSPMRFVWDYNERYLKERNHKPSVFVRMFLTYLRMWDKSAADRPDFLIANSTYTQKRIEKYYRRESAVIYPPVGNNFEFRISNFESGQNEKTYEISDSNFFLVVSRLSPSKKVDMVVEAFNKLGLPLIIIGEGTQKKYLKKIANDNVRILGWQDDQAVATYLAKARGFIFPAEDDFGIAPVEAMLRGVPVIALRKGGVLETVKEGITGEFFDAQTAEVLADGVRRFMLNEDKYDKEIIKKYAQNFSQERFREKMKEFIDSKLQS
jgi:glycosyltransferase involved in cell wall biosynthesis